LQFSLPITDFSCLFRLEHTEHLKTVRRSLAEFLQFKHDNIFESAVPQVIHWFCLHVRLSLEIFKVFLMFSQASEMGGGRSQPRIKPKRQLQKLRCNLKRTSRRPEGCYVRGHSFNRPHSEFSWNILPLESIKIPAWGYPKCIRLPAVYRQRTPHRHRPSQPNLTFQITSSGCHISPRLFHLFPTVSAVVAFYVFIRLEQAFAPRKLISTTDVLHSAFMHLWKLYYKSGKRYISPRMPLFLPILKRCSER
jgi:hypothetical protein